VPAGIGSIGLQQRVFKAFIREVPQRRHLVSRDGADGVGTMLPDLMLEVRSRRLV
jgi:hypothetical protein